MLKKILSLVVFAAVCLQAEEEVHRVVILGGGMGGMTAGIYVGRSGMTPIVVEGPTPGGAMVQSHMVQNWPGEADIPGWELMDKVHKQAELNGCKFIKEEVVAVDFNSCPFVITTRDPYQPDKLNKMKAQSCVIALGSSPKYLGVPGEDSYWLNGVYNCAVCDGALFKNKVVAVVGGGDSAIVEAHYLSNLAKKVIILVRGNSFKTVEEHRKNDVLSKPNVEVRYQTTVEEIQGDGEVATQLLIKSKDKLLQMPIDGVFLAIGSKPNTDFFQGQLELDKNGYIVLKHDTETSVPGVYAIGDITDPVYKQAISAADGGMKASYQIEKYLASTNCSSHLSSASNATVLKSSTKGHEIDIKSVDQFEKEKNCSMPVLVDFYATWCGPCKYVAPYFDSAAKSMGGRASFLKVDVDAVPSLSDRYSIGSMPTLIVFNRRGKMLGRMTGSKDIAKFLQEVSKYKDKTNKQLDSFLEKELRD